MSQRTRYVIHARTNGELRTIYADSERTALRIEQGLDKDPDSEHLGTSPEIVRTEYGQAGPATFRLDVIVAVALIAALLYGVGVL